ncbi:MAG: hypothetical protein AM325_011050 [Candidatus Thorarchaeota archaeon SMTZ1-45]|nr:MAG: hypothetical protein AM325_12750 [Candidatus Thorarchaeota archaeon SMTZ1-45]
MAEDWLKEIAKQNEMMKEVIAAINQASERIDLTNRLLAHVAISGMEKVKDKSLTLLNLGLKPKDVSMILGVHLGTVTKAKSRAEGKTKH